MASTITTLPIRTASVLAMPPPKQKPTTPILPLQSGRAFSQRAAAMKPPQARPERGYAKLYAQEILGADDGCDFAFLRPKAAAG